MGRRGGFGVGQQGFHPRARGALGVKTNGPDAYGLTGAEMTEHYFVPSFSIRRHLHESELAKWAGIQKQIGSIVGRRHFDVMAPQELAVKSIEQKTMIEKIRESGVQPSARVMRDAAYNIRDELSAALETVPEPLEIGLGKLAVFGRKQNKLGFEIEGWKGWRARYSLLTQQGELTAPGALVLENHIAVGGIASALPDTEFSMNQIAKTPHLTVARNPDKIRDHQLRRIQAQVDELDIESVFVNDPVISFKSAPWERAETIWIDRQPDEPVSLRLLA